MILILLRSMVRTTRLTVVDGIRILRERFQVTLIFLPIQFALYIIEMVHDTTVRSTILLREIFI